MNSKINDLIQQLLLQVNSRCYPYAQKIEASYIPQNDLFIFDPNKMRPYFNEGNFSLAHYGNNFMIELFVLRDKGINIIGPDIKLLIKEISEDAFKKAIQKNFHEYWEPMLNDNLKLGRSDYQVFAILTMCRTLYSLETNKVTSKINAANWAINKNDGHWKILIEQALALETKPKIK